MTMKQSFNNHPSFAVESNSLSRRNEMKNSILEVTDERDERDREERTDLSDATPKGASQGMPRQPQFYGTNPKNIYEWSLM
jgi:hypothetical protein